MLNVSVARSMLTSNDDSHAGMYAQASTSTLSRIVDQHSPHARSPGHVALSIEVYLTI
jgi:hypothetical protein